jgi:hypothetical protein
MCPLLQRKIALTILESSSPQGYNRNSIVDSFVYLFCTCQHHPSFFSYYLLYDVNEYATYSQVQTVVWAVL